MDQERVIDAIAIDIAISRMNESTFYNTGKENRFIRNEDHLTSVVYTSYSYIPVAAAATANTGRQQTAIRAQL